MSLYQRNFITLAITISLTSLFFFSPAKSSRYTSYRLNNIRWTGSSLRIKESVHSSVTGDYNPDKPVYNHPRLSPEWKPYSFFLTDFLHSFEADSFTFEKEPWYPRLDSKEQGKRWADLLLREAKNHIQQNTGDQDEFIRKYKLPYKIARSNQNKYAILEYLAPLKFQLKLINSSGDSTTFKLKSLNLPLRRFLWNPRGNIFFIEDSRNRYFFRLEGKQWEKIKYARNSSTISGWVNDKQVLLVKKNSRQINGLLTPFKKQTEIDTKLVFSTPYNYAKKVTDIDWKFKKIFPWPVSKQGRILVVLGGTSQDQYPPPPTFYIKGFLTVGDDKFEFQKTAQIGTAKFSGKYLAGSASALPASPHYPYNVFPEAFKTKPIKAETKEILAEFTPDSDCVLSNPDQSFCYKPVWKSPEFQEPPDFFWIKKKITGPQQTFNPKLSIKKYIFRKKPELRVEGDSIVKNIPFNSGRKTLVIEATQTTPPYTFKYQLTPTHTRFLSP